MKIVNRGMALAFAALILAGWALPAPAETVLYGFNVASNGYAPVASNALWRREQQRWDGFQADSALKASRRKVRAERAVLK
jgi:hypothetical protein